MKKECNRTEWEDVLGVEMEKSVRVTHKVMALGGRWEGIDFSQERGCAVSMRDLCSFTDCGLEIISSMTEGKSYARYGGWRI